MQLSLLKQQSDLIEELKSHFVGKYPIMGNETMPELILSSETPFINCDVNKLRKQEIDFPDENTYYEYMKFRHSILDGYGKIRRLGQYIFDERKNKGTVTLFLLNISNTAQSIDCIRSYLYLIGYVYIHEMFHAYFDVAHNTKVKEIEESIVEAATLDFFRELSIVSDEYRRIFSLVKNEIIQKKYFPDWMSSYGFGEYIFQNDEHKNLIDRYRNINRTISLSNSDVDIFSRSFEDGYPWGNEHVVYKNLLKILNSVPEKRTSKSSGSKSHALDLVDIIVAIANRQVDRIISNASIVKQAYFGPNGLNLSVADLAKSRYSDLLDIHTKLQNGCSLDEYDALKLLFPRYLIVRRQGKANVIYTSKEESARYPKYDLAKASINHKVYYIISPPKFWRGTNGNHRDDFISHIEKLAKIMDSNGNPLFFIDADILNIIAAFEKINGPLYLRFD